MILLVKKEKSYDFRLLNKPKKGVFMSQTEHETEHEDIAALTFEEGTILHTVNVEKFTKEAKESFTIESSSTDERFRIKRDVMLELAQQWEKNKEVFSLLLSNGYEASGSMPAGAGKAVKMKSEEEYYHATFYTGEVGKAFDPKKINSKCLIALNRSHLEAIFVFLINDHMTKFLKAEAKKLLRTTLVLK